MKTSQRVLVVKWLAIVIILTVLYYGTAKFGATLALPIPPGNITAVWLPASIAWAAVLLFGYRIVPGIWLGDFLFTIEGALASTTDTGAVLKVVASTALFATGAVMEATVGGLLIRRFAPGRYPFERVQGVFGFVLIVGFCTAVNAFNGVVILCATCYPGQLNQVFMNLMANAIDALEESNQSRTKAERTANPNQLAIATHRQNDSIVIRIADNGAGMTETTKQKLFDAFFTTKPTGQGTGLGLSISKQIIEENHQGQLSVTSEINQGTEFTITIPINLPDKNHSAIETRELQALS